ncbi:DUF3006 domain-containing protein [Clostridium beijerinckii]|nr:DUF3006 domain-containing protein [Clostridium beijerinckii]
MKVIIDRFEGNYAVCEKEDGSMINIEREKIPSVSKEGDVLLVTDKEITIDEISTRNRKEEIEELTRDLWK